MRLKSLLMVALILTTSFNLVLAQQRMQEREKEFLRSKPLIGDLLPDVTIYAADGSPFKMADLRGHYTVLTFGCLTCPPSMWNIAGLEAVHRDYSPKGVKFYFIYKALRIPNWKTMCSLSLKKSGSRTPGRRRSSLAQRFLG